MKARVFFDTNVLVYADDADSGPKRDRARALIAAEFANGVLSTQVLVEYYGVARRKLRMDAATAVQRTRDYADMTVMPTNADMVLRALALHQRAGLSHWEALIVQAALDAGCRTLLSEDLQAGRTVDGLHVINPFASP
jgi:predicted nucleic acid-binding protein